MAVLQRARTHSHRHDHTHMHMHKHVHERVRVRALSLVLSLSLSIACARGCARPPIRSLSHTPTIGAVFEAPALAPTCPGGDGALIFITLSWAVFSVFVSCALSILWVPACVAEMEANIRKCSQRNLQSALKEVEGGCERQLDAFVSVILLRRARTLSFAFVDPFRKLSPSEFVNAAWDRYHSYARSNVRSCL